MCGDMATPLTRCPWCESDPLLTAYHDTEWGVPQRDDRRLFEALNLEGAQADLREPVLLQRREHYRRAFHGFDIDTVARYESRDHDRLMNDAGVLRDRRKIEAVIRNARGARLLAREFGSFGRFLWRFVDGKPRQNAWERLEDVPTVAPEAERMSRELRRFGFNLVSPPVCYAFMQTVGMVNDHLVACHRHAEVARLG